jgi:hypothetical protein
LKSAEIAKTAFLSPLRAYRTDMNLQNSSINPQETVPAEYVPPMSLHRFCEITGLSKASAWRYEKRGWLRTHLIANRRYVLAADVAEFNRRLALDEFAGTLSNLSAVRQVQTKETMDRRNTK